MIPHNRLALGAEEIEAAARAMRSQWLAQGEEVRRFEEEFCDYLSLPSGNAVAVSSGTAALFLALWSLETRGQEVAFPVYACSALRNAVAMAGARQTLVDVSPGSPNIDPAAAARLVAGIVIAPHMFGLPMDLRCMEGKRIVEDCAQSLGASAAGRKTGLLGCVGIYSFYATKMITSGGQGGMLVSNDSALVEAVRDYRNFDCRRDEKIRFNFQMTDLQAAIGRAQLAKLPFFIERRADIYSRYSAVGCDLLDIPKDHVDFEPVRYRAVMRTERPREIIRALANQGITAIVPIEDWELAGKDEGRFPNAMNLTRNTVSLPVYPSLTDREVETIIACVGRLL
jgi:perosamine synthetase